MSKMSRYETWMILAPLLGIGAAFVGLFYLPIQGKIRALESQARDKEEFVHQAESMVAVVDATSQALRETRGYVKPWKAESPKRNDLYRLFSKVSELAKDSGAVTTRFEPQPVTEYETLRRIPLELGCTGSFEQIYRFLSELEKLPQEIWIERANVRKEGEDGGYVECDIRLAIFADNPRKSDQAERNG